jgi:hypothetical protein
VPRGPAATYIAFTDHLCKAWHLATKESLPKTICGKTLFVEDDCQSDDLSKIGCGSCKRSTRYREALAQPTQAEMAATVTTRTRAASRRKAAQPAS